MIAASQPESESESGSESGSEIVADTPPALQIAPAHVADAQAPVPVHAPNSPITPLSYDETSDSTSDSDSDSDSDSVYIVDAPPSPPPPSPPPVPDGYFMSWNGRTNRDYQWHRD
jgi:hypothetical protein